MSQFKILLFFIFLSLTASAQVNTSNIEIVNWGIYGNIGGGKGHKPPEAKMGHPTNKNKRHHTPHTGTGGNVQEGDDGGE